ncbi:MAG: molecular chaperone DnaJ, partial [Actinomycetota bacterium]|nr:molecular chaperone DnaJ [Actinomycetota bacterium]
SGGPSRGVRRGADLQAEARVSFEDAIHGTTVPVTVSGPATCSTCRGSGAKPGTSVTTCPDCAGAGTVSVDQGLFSMSRTCPRCGGGGRVVEESCPTCRGAGRTTRRRELKVRIPPGIEDGGRIRLSGRGEPGSPGGRAGDLYVVVRVAPHPHFARRGSDLTLTLPVTYPEAALGAQVKVPTLNGAVTLKIPSGTAPGRTFRVRGKGAPRRAGGHGDLLVTVQVEVPQRLSRQEKELLKQMRDAQRTSPRARLGVGD